MKRPFALAHDRPGKLQKVARIPVLHGPVHDARYIDALYKRPLKSSLVDNPKSPVANFAALSAIPLNYHFTDWLDPAANKTIIRSVPSCTLHHPLTSP